MRTSPSVPGLGTNPCLGKHFRQRVTACEVRGPFFSRTRMAYEETPTLPNQPTLLKPETITILCSRF
jgi:hypothetical protein